MNCKRVILATMAAVAVVSFADPVAAQSTLQSVAPAYIMDAFKLVAENIDTVRSAINELADFTGIS
jgi:hypothetical protein